MNLILYSSRTKRSHIEEATATIFNVSKTVIKRRGLSTATLYHWRQQLRRSGAAVPNSNTSSEQWSVQTQLVIVAETSSMTGSELSKT
ncbi:hypothetical protein ACODM8_03450 [Vibrio ostreicida]|uniref:hypothetical protein n=1 Tax=Vibrio ostreicida TaxID=526588 RepID=UPI003B5A4D66